MTTRCSVMNSLDSTLSPSQVLNMPLSSLLDGNVPSQSCAPRWINPDTLLQCRLKEPSYTRQGAEKRDPGSVAVPLRAGVDGTHQSPRSASHPQWVSIHFTIIQMVSLWQCLAALLPAPWGTLAGGGPPTVSDDVGLLQAVAEGCLTKYSRHHLSRAQMPRKQTAHPAKQPWWHKG